MSKTRGDIKEWEDARCSVCMDHPHNCILLICTSYENGCRPYMCDTSHFHSNCLHQFLKVSKGTTVEAAASDPRLHGDESSRVSNQDKEEAIQILKCPLCRGFIKRYDVIDDAREFMNSKVRSCSCEDCDYRGTYDELEKHVRVKHPNARPSEVDPKRKRRWRLERRRNIGHAVGSFMRFSLQVLTEYFGRPGQYNGWRNDGSSSSSFSGRSR